MKSRYGSELRVGKITGLHQSVDKVIPAAPNAHPADVRGHCLRMAVTERTSILVKYIGGIATIFSSKEMLDEDRDSDLFGASLAPG
jgi:hypothetical protein